MKFIFCRQNINVELLFDFISRLIKSNDRKVFLILNNLRVNDNKELTSFLEENNKSLRVCNLPTTQS